MQLNETTAAKRTFELCLTEEELVTLVLMCIDNRDTALMLFCERLKTAAVEAGFWLNK